MKLIVRVACYDSWKQWSQKNEHQSETQLHETRKRRRGCVEFTVLPGMHTSRTEPNRFKVDGNLVTGLRIDALSSTRDTSVRGDIF